MALVNLLIYVESGEWALVNAPTPDYGTSVSRVRNSPEFHSGTRRGAVSAP